MLKQKQEELLERMKKDEALQKQKMEERQRK